MLPSASRHLSEKLYELKYTQGPPMLRESALVEESDDET